MAEDMVIPQRKAAPSFENIDKAFDNIKYLFTFFDYIELNNIQFENNKLNIIFADDILYVTSNDYEIAGNIQRVGQMFEVDVSMLHLKKDNVDITGKLTYDPKTNNLKTQGNFDAYGIRGRFFVKKIDNMIDFNLDSDMFSDLQPLIDKFNLDDTVKTWNLDKLKAESYQLLELSAKASIVNKQFKIDMDTLKAKTLFNGTKIYFKEDVKPVLAPSLVLSYENDGLYFDFKEPTYEERSLKGSKVAILNMSDANTTLKLDLKLDTLFDVTMQNLLKSYDLELPVLQESGQINAVFHADIGLKNDYRNFLVDANFTKGSMWLNKVKLPIVKGQLHYEKGVISLNNIVLKDTMYDVVVGGKIDLTKQKADFLVKAKTIELEAKGEKFFVLKDQAFPVILKYKKNLNIVLPKFATQITNTKEETRINVADLSKIKTYLTGSGPLGEGGNIDIKTKDFKTYAISGLLKRSSCVLYEKEDQCETRVPFHAILKPSAFDFYAFDKRVHYSKEKSRLSLQDINIDLEKFLKTQVKESIKEGSKLLVLGKNSNLRYGDYTLLTDSYDVEIQKNGDIKAIGSSDGDIIKISKIKDIVSMQALRIKDKALHSLINFDGLHDGRYSFKTEGEPETMMKGEIIVEGGVMKDFKAYNNTLALVNTLPALAVLHNPGFSQKGFAIEEGVVEYRMIERKKIIFDSVYVKGAAATIVGRGELDLEKKTIHMSLAIHVARQLGEFIGSLPLVGYIVMGEDKGITVGLEITGNLDKPVVKTSVAKEILTLPLQILQRTLEFPAKIMKKQE